MYGRIVNGFLIYAPRTLTVNGRVHYHPSHVLYRKCGYLPIVDTPMPRDKVMEMTDDGYTEKASLKYTWQQRSHSIVKVWTEDKTVDA